MMETILTALVTGFFGALSSHMVHVRERRRLAEESAREQARLHQELEAGKQAQEESRLEIQEKLWVSLQSRLSFELNARDESIRKLSLELEGLRNHIKVLEGGAEVLRAQISALTRENAQLKSELNEERGLRETLQGRLKQLEDGGNE